MKRLYAGLNVLPSTAHNLKLLAAFHGETMLALLDRLIADACREAGLHPHHKKELHEDTRSAPADAAARKPVRRGRQRLPL